MSECPLHSYLESGTTLPLLPPDFHIGICKKENNSADLTRTRSAPDAMKNPVCWVVLTGIFIAFIQQGKIDIFGRFKYNPESVFWQENHWFSFGDYCVGLVLDVRARR